MLPDLYTTYGWPTGAQSYDIEFWNGTTVETIETGFTQNEYTYGASPEYPGLLLVYPVTISRRSRPYTFPVNDPASISSVRWMVRTAISDLETTPYIDIQYPDAPKWPDREIDGYIREAIGLFNNYNRQEIIVETALDLLRPEVLGRFSSVSKVAYLERDRWIHIPRYERRVTEAPAQYWDFVDGHLRLNGNFSPTSRIEIHGEAPYPLPMNDLAELHIERECWDILSMYAQGRCYLRLAGQSAQLDRWKETGWRNDNPLTPIARLLLEKAEQQMKSRPGIRAVRRFRA
jgi:hypothetical protein